jgi:hypothetical protein
MAGFDNDFATALVISYRQTGDLNTLGKIAQHCYSVVEAEVSKYPHLLEAQQKEDWNADFYKEKLRGVIKHYDPSGKKGKFFSLLTTSAQNFVRSKLIKFRDRGMITDSKLAMIAGGDLSPEEMSFRADTDHNLGCSRNRFHERYSSKYIRGAF